MLREYLSHMWQNSTDPYCCTQDKDVSNAEGCNNRFKGLLKIAEHLIENRVKNMEIIRKSKTTTLQKIAQIKRKLNFWEPEMTFETELDLSVKILIRNEESEISKIEIHRKYVVMSEKLEFLTKHESESQILMLSNNISVDISKQKDNFHKFISV